MFELTKLDYSYDALEPNIDMKTMGIHHSKHHQAYTDNFNKVLEDNPALAGMQLEEIFKNLKTLNVPEEDRNKIRNHGGGYINHKIFWESIGPEKQINKDLIGEIEESFGSVDKFKEEFSAAAIKQFGSGWAWLVRDENNELKAYALPNQDSPYTIGHTPVFNLDVWEHAYYLKYQNQRAEYVEAFWKVVMKIW